MCSFSYKGFVESLGGWALCVGAWGQQIRLDPTGSFLLKAALASDRISVVVTIEAVNKPRVSLARTIPYRRENRPPLLAGGSEGI